MTPERTGFERHTQWLAFGGMVPVLKVPAEYLAYVDYEAQCPRTRATLGYYVHHNIHDF